MMAFNLISALPRAFFALWGLLLCLVNISCGLLAIVNKRWHFPIFAVLLFAPSYFMWQVAFDLSLLPKTGDLTSVTQAVCGIDWIWWFVIFIGLTAGSIILLVYNVRYDNSHITPSAIKLYLDKIPCGVCCYTDNGRVLFSNICMNELCLEITKTPLQNGNVFKDAIQEGIIIAKDRVWRFTCRDIGSGTETLHEIVASDITTEYAETQALEKDKIELSKLNEELRDYYLSIDETVRRQEILQAKVNIHDEMNKLMLSTMAVENDNPSELDNIFSLWEQNALLLCMEAEKTSETKEETSLDNLAKALKVNLIWDGNGLEELSKKQRELFYSAAQEAIINAVKHAGAKTMRISFIKEKDSICCNFTNDGKIENKNISFSGGLGNLARLSEQQNATLSVNVENEFILSLCFKK